MSDTIIAFDPSLNSTGIAVFKGGKPHKYESVSAYPLTDLQRIYYNYQGFRRILSVYPDIQCIAFEKQIPQMRYHSNTGSILGLAENIGVLKLAIIDEVILKNPEVIVLAVPPQDIKIFATGNGKATKEEMMDAVNKNHMKSIRSVIPEWSVNDVADAYHLAQLADSCLKDSTYEKYLYSFLGEFAHI